MKKNLISAFYFVIRKNNWIISIIGSNDIFYTTHKIAYTQNLEKISDSEKAVRGSLANNGEPVYFTLTFSSPVPLITGGPETCDGGLAPGRTFPG